MSWQERGYGSDGGGHGFGRPGGDWRGLRPTFDNPLSWSIPIGRLFGIDVRVHVMLLLFILFELYRTAFGRVDEGESAPLGVTFAAILLGGLFVLVLLHEFGHCFACRSVGGEANEILMWPLGGLAMCLPPHHWKAHLWTVVGGPLVNVVLAIVFGCVLGMLTGRWWGVALPNPLVDPPSWWNLEQSTWLLGLYLVARINVILILFNLIPMFPMDGARVMQALLWKRLDYTRSMRITLRVGYVAAIGLGLFGAARGDVWLVLLAIFGGFTCWNTHRQLTWTDEVMANEYGASLAMTDEPEPAPAPSTKALKRAEQEAKAKAEEDAELDRLLAKIRDTGMEGLSPGEKRWLEEHSRRRRTQQSE